MKTDPDEYSQWWSQNKKWLVTFIMVAVTGHAGLGTALAVFGPTQPYLGKQVGVDVDTVNFIWTARSIGFACSSLVTAFVFRRFCRTTGKKLAFLALGELITAAFLMMTPFATTLPHLMALVTVTGIGLGMFDTADNSLMVYIFGPEKSRPFSQLVHAWVGVGFLATVPISSPFLPASEDSTEAVCPGGASNSTGLGNNDNSSEIQAWTPPMLAGISSISWPYIIFGLWHIMTASGLLIIAATGSKMPRFQAPSPGSAQDEDSEGNDEKGVFTNLRFGGPVIAMVFFYYVLTCGLEGFFQAMTYTYGICGPLKMTVTQASLLNTLYYAGFMSGRFSGIFISRLIQPRTLIFASISACICSATILSIWAGGSMVGVYIGAGLMGYAISFQFASGISWTAERFDVTGNAACVFFFGAFTGFLSFPPLAGMTFTSDVGPIGIFYLTLGFSGLLFLHFCLMNFCSQFKKADHAGSDDNEAK